MGANQAGLSSSFPRKNRTQVRKDSRAACLRALNDGIDASGVLFNEVSHFGQQGEFRGPGGFHPVPEELQGSGFRSIAPAPVEIPLQCPRGAGLQVLDEQVAELHGGPLPQVFMPPQPQVFGAGQDEVPGGTELPALPSGNCASSCRAASMVRSSTRSMTQPFSTSVR